MFDNPVAKLTVIFVVVLLAVGCATEAVPVSAPSSDGSEAASAVQTIPATNAPAPTATPPPTFTPLPTYTPPPTHTPLPTHTPYPTFTPAPAPTNTPKPTNTPRATNTPLPPPTPNPFGKWQQDEWQNRSDETYHEVFVPSEQSRESRLRLVCTPSGYTSAVVNWGADTVVAKGTELKNDAGETWATAHAVSVRFDDYDAIQETWWLRSTGNFSRVRQAYYRGAHPAFIRELRQAETLTVWADSEMGSVSVEFDVRNLGYALSQNPEHCREPDAYGKWVYSEWENLSGKKGYEFFLYAEGLDNFKLSIWCYANGSNAVQFDWGEHRPAVSDDAFEVKRSDGTLHSTSHPVRVRYGNGIAQLENWQLFSPSITSRNRSLPGAYVGDGDGRIADYQQVDTLTIWTDTESETIRAEFDVRSLDQALSRLNQHCY